VGAVREHRSGDAMTGTADWLLWGIAALAILVSFANPGGFIIGAAIAIVLLGGRYGLPFVGDYLKADSRASGRPKRNESSATRCDETTTRNR